MKLKIVVEHHPDGYIAYPIGLRGACIGQGDTADEAIADVTSAIETHIDVFGADAFDESQPDEVFLTEAAVGP